MLITMLLCVRFCDRERGCALSLWLTEGDRLTEESAAGNQLQVFLGGGAATGATRHGAGEDEDEDKGDDEDDVCFYSECFRRVTFPLM